MVSVFFFISTSAFIFDSFKTYLGKKVNSWYRNLIKITIIFYVDKIKKRSCFFIFKILLKHIVLYYKNNPKSYKVIKHHSSNFNHATYLIR